MTSPPPRSARWTELLERPPQVLVVGGGITGAGIALDLALRGLRTALVERDDWAAATSSASSRLIHGGLRYLEQFELGLVRESCLERALLLQNAAGLVWPESFTFPVRRGDRVGRTKMMLGLWLYTALSFPRALGRPERLSAADVRRRIPGIASGDLVGGGAYLDAATDDARLTLAVALAAGQAGATCLSRVELLELENGASGVAAQLLDRESGERHELAVRAVVLAGGPGTEALRARAGLGGRWITPTRGSHVLVDRARLPTDGAVIFPTAVDGRVMFLIPWPRHTAIGTTDLDADPAAPPRATRAEVEYLLASANALVPAAELGPDDVVSTWSGLRPLLAAPGEDPSQRSREERIERDGSVWTIAGGKLTGYRAMAEKLVRSLGDVIGGPGPRRSPTRSRPLPGALARPVERPGWSRLAGGAPALERSAREVAFDARYGARAPEVLALCRHVDGGETELAVDTLLGEVDWAVAEEDARGLVDVFFRRTDLGLDPDAARRSGERVARRMGALLAWDDERHRRERDELDAELARRSAWRDDPAQ